MRGVGLPDPSHFGQLSEAVEALDLLVRRQSYVDNSVFYGVLKRCIEHKDLVLGIRVHAIAVTCGYEANAFLANHIICMYASHGRLADATCVFTKVSKPNRYVWASIILAHARHGHPTQAIRLYQQMRQSTVKPDNHTFVAVLKACATAKDLLSGREVHADILVTADKPDVFVSNCLVDMYAKCGSLEDARKVFDSLRTKDVVTWTSMIAGYAQHGLGQEALTLYASMEKEGITPANHVTFVCLLQACASIGVPNVGKQLHAHILKSGLEYDVVVGNCLVDMYSKCGSLGNARSVFDNLPSRNVVTWNAMIAGYVQHGRGQEALALYASMPQEIMASANHVTFLCLLQACSSVGALHQGMQFHAQIEERGLLVDTVVGNCLVDMYSKCGSLKDARKVFDKLPTKDVVTWNAMIAGYAQHGSGQEALALYASMQHEVLTPANDVTFICLLQACASIGALNQGKQLHAQIQESGLRADTLVGNSLVTMYAKCGSLEDARGVFDNLPRKSVASWNAMIAGYAQHELGHEALSLYASMQQEGMTQPDAVTYVCVLQACSCAAALGKGREIHLHIWRCGLDSTHLFVGNALIDMYSKCGSVSDAQQVFDALPTRDIVTWSALIAGYARQGESGLVFDLFHQMTAEGIFPDAVTVLSVLTVCSHVGLVEEGQKYFELMSKDYNINATIEHYRCMVDLLGRAGQVEKAMEMVKTMPFQPHGEVWRCMLCACQKWSKVEIGRQAFEWAIRLDKSDVAAYVLMSNIYAAANMWEEAQEIHMMRVQAGAWKMPGLSWCHDNCGIVHTFLVGDREHPDSQLTYANLEDFHVRITEEGYLLDLDSVVRHS